MKSFLRSLKLSYHTSSERMDEADAAASDETTGRPTMLKRSTGKNFCTESMKSRLDDADVGSCDEGECLTDTDETADPSLAPEEEDLEQSRAIQALTCSSSEDDPLEEPTAEEQTHARVSYSTRGKTSAETDTGARAEAVSRVQSLRVMLERREEDLARAELKARVVYFISRDCVRSEAVPGLLVGPQRIRRFLKFNTFERHVTILPDEWEMVEINMENVLSNYCDRSKLREFELEAALSLPQQVVASRSSSVASSINCTTERHNVSGYTAHLSDDDDAQVGAEEEVICYTARDGITVTALVGLSAGNGKIRRFLDYNKFSKEVIEVPNNYERRQLDPHLLARFYSGSRLSSSLSSKHCPAVYDGSGRKHTVLNRSVSEIMMQHCAQFHAADNAPESAVTTVSAADNNTIAKKVATTVEEEEVEVVQLVDDDMSNLLDTTDPASGSFRQWAVSDAIAQSVLDAAAACRST